jgi:hypothetical protein
VTRHICAFAENVAATDQRLVLKAIAAEPTSRDRPNQQKSEVQNFSASKNICGIVIGWPLSPEAAEAGNQPVPS